MQQLTVLWPDDEKRTFVQHLEHWATASTQRGTSLWPDRVETSQLLDQVMRKEVLSILILSGTAYRRLVLSDGIITETASGYDLETRHCVGDGRTGKKLTKELLLSYLRLDRRTGWARRLSVGDRFYKRYRSGAITESLDHRFWVLYEIESIDESGRITATNGDVFKPEHWDDRYHPNNTDSVCLRNRDRHRFLSQLEDAFAMFDEDKISNLRYHAERYYPKEWAALFAKYK